MLQNYGWRYKIMLYHFFKRKRVVLAIILLFMIACAGPSHMVRKEQSPSIKGIKPISGKAMLIVARTTSAGFNVEFFNYIDKRFIGVTKGRSFFIVNDVEPGKRIMISRADNIDAIRIDFKPGMVYCVLQYVGFPDVSKFHKWFTPSSPFEKVGVTIKEITIDEMIEQLNDNVPYFTIDPSNPGKDLSEEEFQNISAALK